MTKKRLQKLLISAGVLKETEVNGVEEVNWDNEDMQLALLAKQTTYLKSIDKTMGFFKTLTIIGLSIVGIGIFLILFALAMQ